MSVAGDQDAASGEGGGASLFGFSWEGGVPGVGVSTGGGGREVSSAEEFTPPVLVRDGWEAGASLWEALEAPRASSV